MIAAPARIRVICAQSTECPLDTALGAAMTPDTKHFEPNLYTPTDALQFDFRKLPKNVDLLEQSIADHRCGKGGEGLMEVCAAVPAAASKGRFSKTNYTDCVGS